MAPPKPIRHAVDTDSNTTFCGLPIAGKSWMQWERLRDRLHVESRTWGTASFTVCPDCWNASLETRKYLG